MLYGNDECECKLALTPTIHLKQLSARISYIELCWHRYSMIHDMCLYNQQGLDRLQPPRQPTDVAPQGFQLLGVVLGVVL